MPTEVIMPELGESVEEATITQWLKAVGDEVKEFEPLLEVNTDKVDTEIPSPVAGVILQILADADQVVQAGDTIAWIGEAGDAVPAGDGNGKAKKTPTPAAVPEAETQPTKVVSAPAAQPTSSVSQKPGRNDKLGFISPVVAKMASEHNLDLSQLSGTGKDGRITKRDVDAYLATGAPKSAPLAAAPAPIKPPAPPALPGRVDEAQQHAQIDR